MATAAACPGCLAVPVEPVSATAEPARIALSLPGIHCQNCIAEVERALAAVPGVRSARVNLTLKRALVDAGPAVSAAELVTRLDAIGHEAHELDSAALGATQSDATGRALLLRLAVAGFASMNVMLLSVSVWSGASDATRDLFHWISAAIALPAVGYAAQPFFVSAWGALRARRLNMDVPITLALLLALGTSLWATSLSGHHAYFDAALTLTFFLLAGRYLDHRTRAAARSAAQELTALEVPRALKLVDGVPVETQAAELKVGDLVLVHPGARTPVDGEIVEGASELDRSLLTGETTPVAARKGDTVSAGEINLTGALSLRATAVGQNTSLRRMADLVAVAESGRARYTPLADAAARLYAPGVHILAVLGFAGWYLATGDLRAALGIAAAVLIITCPCALGLAVPAVTTAASGRLFRDGLLVKDATALERLAEIDTVVFDKTGTLTEGLPQPLDLDRLDATDRSVALALAQGSSHPLSRALAKALREEGVAPAELRDVTEVPGSGISARIGTRTVRLGRAEWLGGAVGDGPATWLDTGDGRPPRAVLFADTLRPGATELVEAFTAAGLDLHLFSGDAEPAVQAKARDLGIATWRANMRPEDKARAISDLAAQGRNVLMIGDGLNDTAALASAHVSISPASALDAARAASDIVLLGRSLGPVARAHATSIRATRRIRENFRIATLYNVVAVPLALAGLATPLIAAIAMSASSITVSLNALRLGR